MPQGILLGTESGNADVMLTANYGTDQTILKAYQTNVLVPAVGDGGINWYWESQIFMKGAADPTLIIHQVNNNYTGGKIRLSGQGNNYYGQVNGKIEFAKSKAEDEIAAYIYSRTDASNGVVGSDHGGAGTNNDGDWPSNLVFSTTANGAATPTDRMTIGSDGAVTLNTINEIGSDTDKFLMSDSGVVKYVTGANLLSYSGAQASLTFGIADTNAVKIDSGSVADDEYARFTANGLESRSTSEVLSDIGAQATVTAGTNCTFSGATLNVDDAFVKNDADDTMTGTLTIDKNVTSTSDDTYRGLLIDFEKTGSSTGTNRLRGIEIDLTNTTATGGLNIATGIKNTITLQHAADSGTAHMYGFFNDVIGHDNNDGTSYGMYNKVQNGDGLCIGFFSNVINGQPDMKFVSSANTADIFTIDTDANAETTFTTAQWQGNTSAHMNFVAGGNIVLDSNNDIEINANGGDITFKDDTTDLGSWDSSGNLLVKGDLIIDDGGSIKEAGGTAAITIDAAGEVSKIGQDSPSDGEVLTWDNSNSKVVWASGGGGASALNDLSDVTYSSGDLTISSLDTIISGALTLDSSGDITFDSANGIFHFLDDEDSNDAFKITVVGGTGATTLETVSEAADGFLTLKPDASAVIIDSADLQLYPTQKLYFDSGGDTYINESSADVLNFVVGGDSIMTLNEATTNGNWVDFGTSGAGWTQFQPSYDATDTNVYFNRYGNKAYVAFGGGDITDLNLYFPNVSCNCILLLRQDGPGGRNVTYYKTFDQSQGNESTVVWAGGSNPTLTTAGNKIDILSFYWDNDNHKAYGVATLNFAA